jgi:hypothetical protein
MKIRQQGKIVGHGKTGSALSIQTEDGAAISSQGLIMPNNIDGSWGELLDWPLIPIHAILLANGKILTFGTDANGMQGAGQIYDVYDPVTGTHTTLPNLTLTDIFCSAAIILPARQRS